MYNLNALSNITPKFKWLLLQIKNSPGSHFLKKYVYSNHATNYYKQNKESDNS